MATLHRDTQQMRLMKRAEKVRHMRLSGFTYRQIADHLHVSIGTCLLYTSPSPRD